MPHFTIGDAAPIPPVAASLTVDEDGDLLLTIDGIDVLFVSSGDGRLYTFYVDNADKLALAARGISFTGDYITTN